MAQPKERSQVKIERERAVLAAVHLPDSRFDVRDPLGELRALAETTGATVVGEMTQNRARPETGTYIGSGKVEELKAMCEELQAGVIIFDHELSPKQIGNIEKITERKVLDRSELILDIFASRATTRQSQIAVELAQLEYTYPRLAAMWSHLERIVGVGGIGGVGTRGPGEKQIEIDRRLVMARKTRLRRELEEINARKRREVFARNTENTTIGLVGYTNAGKSTVFNTLTEGGAFAADRLFATLMTRTREWNLGGGHQVLLSDTVGFIRDLPHHLIASFRATLEEATHADCLIVVVDVADAAAQLQYETVMETLADLFKETAAHAKREGIAWREPEIIVALNKTDLLRDKSTLLAWAREVPGSIEVSAIDANHPGIAALTHRVLDISRGPVREVVLTIPMAESKAIDVIEKQAKVLERTYDGASVMLRVEIGDRQVERLRSGGARITVGEAEPSTP